MAYYIASDDRDQVLNHLNYREKNGYSMEIVECFNMQNELITDQVREHALL